MSLTDFIWTVDTFEYNFEINHRFMIYLEENCALGSDEHSYFKYFPKKCSSHKDISKIVGTFLAVTGINRLKQTNRQSHS